MLSLVILESITQIEIFILIFILWLLCTPYFSFSVFYWFNSIEVCACSCVYRDKHELSLMKQAIPTFYHICSFLAYDSAIWYVQFVKDAVMNLCLMNQRKNVLSSFSILPAGGILLVFTNGSVLLHYVTWFY